VDGPFAETKELIAGFWMWNVKSLADAIEWVKRCPNPMMEDSEIEIRQVFETPELTDNPEILNKETELRAQSAKNAGR
jgi:AraC family transcriptional regulator